MSERYFVLEPEYSADNGDVVEEMVMARAEIVFK